MGSKSDGRYDSFIAAIATAAVFAWSALLICSDRVDRLRHYFQTQYPNVSTEGAIPMRWPNEIGLWHEFLHAADSGLFFLVAATMLTGTTLVSILRIMRASRKGSEQAVPVLILAMGWIILIWQMTHLPGAYEF